MVGEGGEVQGTLGANIILEFTKSIENIKNFGDILEGLDGKFGSIESRINALRGSLSTLSDETSRRTGSDLRKSIESEINNIAMANGLVLTTVGTAPFKVKQDTVRHIFRRIDAELNRAIAQSIGDIQITLDPSMSAGRFTLGGSEFTALNAEIARLVKAQVANLVSQVRKEGASAVSSETMAGLELDIGRETVKSILMDVKRKLLPIILNPEIPVEGMNMTLSRRDMQRLVNKIRSQILETLDVDLGKAPEGDTKIKENIRETTRAIDRYINQYVANIRQGMGAFNVADMKVPVENLSQSLRRYIAKDLGITVQKFNEMFKHVSAGEASMYELRRQFSSLENTINTKIRTGTSQIMTDLKRSVRQVEIKPSSRLRHHLIHEINRLNNEIVKKIREQIDRQFMHMRAEIQTVNAAPKDIRRAGRLRSMTAGDIVADVVRPSAQQPARQPVTGYGSDRFARRDAHFGQFGLQGAVVNTFRHVLAGSMVGAPMFAMYQAMDTFQKSQLEQLKIFQNFMLKDDYQKENDQGEMKPDYTSVDRDVNEILRSTKDLSSLYGIGYDEMSRVAGIASRLTSSVDEARQFVNIAGIIQRLDSEGDIVESIAPGLEAVMGQFQKSVWQMDETVRAFAVATNRTKATSDEIMAALQRSGSAFHNAGMGITEGTILSAIAIQNTGLSGENIGNMAKTVMTRLSFPTTQNTLAGYGIDVYERDADGRQRRREAVDVFTDIANQIVLKNIGDDEIDRMFYATAGGFQITKLMSFLESFATVENQYNQGLNFHDLIKQVESISDDDIIDMLSRSLSTTIHNINRAQTSTNLALVSVLEELRPEIDALTSVIVNLTNGMRRHADVFADLVTFIGNTLVGFGAVMGVRKLGEMGGYSQAVERHKTIDSMFGGRGLYTGRVTPGTLSNIIPVVGSTLAAQLSDRSMWDKALKNETLAPIVQELSKMDENRQKEIVSYMERRGTPKDLEGFFGVLDKSRGYSPAERLSAEERQQRAATNARKLAENSVITARVSQSVLMQLADTMNNRTAYLHHNATADGRRVTSALARMDDSQISSFGAHLNKTSPDRQISNMSQFNDVLRGYAVAQSQAVSKTKEFTPQVNEMNKAIQSLAATTNMTAFDRAKNKFGDFLDSIPTRSRGAMASLLNLGRSIGRFARQLAVMYAVGDLITTSSQQALLSDIEKEVQRTSLPIEYSDDYVKYFQRQGQSMNRSPFNPLPENPITLAKNLWDGLVTPLWGEITNLWVGDRVAVGFREQNEMASGFRKHVTDNYGRDAYRELRGNLFDGKDANHYMREYLEASGQYEARDQAERELFLERAKQAWLDDMKVQQYREEAEYAERMTRQEYLRKGEFQYFSESHLKEAIEEEIAELGKTTDLERLQAVLSGVKTNSDRYYDLLIERVEKEQAIQDKYLQGLRDFIEQQRKIVEEMEASGQHKIIDPETGELIDDSELTWAKNSLTAEERKLKNLEEEYAESSATREIERQELLVQKALARVDRVVQEAELNKQLDDLTSSLYLDRESPEYITAQMENTRDLIKSMNEALNDLMAQDLLDPNDELKRRIKELEVAIVGAEVQLKELNIQRVTDYKPDFQIFDSMQELEMLRAQVGVGSTDKDHPVVKALRRTQGHSMVSEIEKIMTDLQARMSDPGLSEDVVRDYQRELIELEKQSLRVQLGMLEEMKMGGGTFNLPEGFQAMSELDYMMSRGTHSSFNMGIGDTHVNVVMPNISHMTTPEQIEQIAYSFAQGLTNGKLSSYRHMLTGGPWGYKALI